MADQDILVPDILHTHSYLSLVSVCLAKRRATPMPESPGAVQSNAWKWAHLSTVHGLASSRFGVIRPAAALNAGWRLSRGFQG